MPFGLKYPAVYKDYCDFFNTIDNLIKKNNLNDVVFFQYINTDISFIQIEDLISYSADKYFKEKYVFIDIPLNLKISKITNSIDSQLKK